MHPHRSLNFIIYIIPLLTIITITVILPENFPITLGIQHIAWEALANVRYYIALCSLHNLSFLVFPFSHPLYSLIGGSFFNLLHTITPWKQMFIYNFTILYISFFIIATIINNSLKSKPISFIIASLIFFQPVLIIWAFSGFAYNTGLLLLSLGTYFYYHKKKTPGILFFSLLPLVRHEFSVFLLAPFITSILRKEKKFWLILLILPFLIYYIGISIILFHNPLYLWLFHMIYNGIPFSHLSAYLTKGIHTLKPFFYYNPIIWIGLIGYFPPFNKTKELAIPTLNSLLLLPVAYLGRTIIPIFFFALIGIGNIFSSIKDKRNQKIIVTFLLLTQIIYIFSIKVKAGDLESILPYHTYPLTYKWLTSNLNKYDYVLPYYDTFYILWEDKDCKLAKKLLYPGGSCKTLNNGPVVTTPDGIIHNKQCIMELKNSKILILLQESDLRTPLFRNLLTKKNWKILKVIPSEKVVIITNIK